MTLKDKLIQICSVAYQHKKMMNTLDDAMKRFYFDGTLSCGCDTCQLVDDTPVLSEAVKDMLWSDTHILKRKKDIIG
jgi:hypothetical protein